MRRPSRRSEEAKARKSGAGAREEGTTAAIITLTTDFGLKDSYVAELKAVILSLVREVHLVDVTHEVEPQQIVEAALALDAAPGFFPPGTIHVAVVDPGVGTERRGIVVVAGGHLFVGPDNGLFTPVVARGAWTAFELAAEEFRLPRSAERSTGATSLRPRPPIWRSAWGLHDSAHRSPTRSACRGPRPGRWPTAMRAP